LPARRTRAALAASVVLLVGAAHVAAHTGIKSTSPKAGASVSRDDLTWVRVTFHARVTDGTISVRSAGGALLSRGKTQLVHGDRQLRVRLVDRLPRGRATASLRVLNADGHVTSRSWSFSLR
jgi:methionine-rich copper-binding protein CopC